MTLLDPAAVVAASNAWLWYPDDATVVDTADYLLVRWPPYFAAHPDLLRIAPDAPLEPILDAAVEQVRSWGEPALVVWAKLDAPEGLEELLRARGAAVDETLDVFALDLADGVPDLDVPNNVLVRWQDTVESKRDGNVVAMAAFEEGAEPDEETLARLAAECADDVAAGRGGSMVAYLDGTPVGTGGLSLADGVARLWGGGVAPAARGRGVYRAVLAARLAYAVDHGATMALVKGRIETSGPILRRVGFAAYGQERSYRLSVPAAHAEQQSH